MIPYRIDRNYDCAYLRDAGLCAFHVIRNDVRQVFVGRMVTVKMQLA